MKKKGGRVLAWSMFMLLACESHVVIAENVFTPFALQTEPPTKRQLRKEKRKKPNRMSKGVENVLRDIFVLHRHIFSFDSFKIWASIFPLFIAARMIDKKIHNCFYDPCRHKNTNQMPSWCEPLAKNLIGVPLAIFGARTIFPVNKDVQQTSRMLLLGLPFVLWGKDLIKKIRFEENLRPKNENFPNEDCLGGFPSGHMAEAMYTAVLFGRRYGVRYGLPLGIVATAVGITFTVCNRHFFSQVIAGAGLGVMYAYAADKVINTNLGKDLIFDVGMDAQGATTFGVKFRF